jgi:hypothetical protein
MQGRITESVEQWNDLHLVTRHNTDSTLLLGGGGAILRNIWESLQKLTVS